MAAGKGYDHVSAGLVYHRMWPIGDVPAPRRSFKAVLIASIPDLCTLTYYDMTSLPYCRYADFVLLEEKIVTKGLINLQDMWAKEFIYIAFA